eukprot:scaffold3287_cov181-Amphora_coffeaeformis.AAC.8
MLTSLDRFGMLATRVARQRVQLLPIFRALVRFSSSWDKPVCDTEYHDTDDQVHRVSRFDDMCFVHEFHSEAEFYPPPPPPPLPLDERIKTFGAESADGTSEDVKDLELHQVEEMIDSAAQYYYHDPIFVKVLPEQQQQQPPPQAARVCFAVDGPDGQADDTLQEELEQVKKVVDDPMHRIERAARDATGSSYHISPWHR